MTKTVVKYECIDCFCLSISLFFKVNIFVAYYGKQTSLHMTVKIILQINFVLVMFHHVQLYNLDKITEINKKQQFLL